MTNSDTMGADREVAAQLCGFLRAGQLDDAVALLHPSFSARLAAGLPAGLGTTYSGPQEMREGVYERVGSMFELGPEVDEILGVESGRIVVVGRYVGHALTTRRSIDAAFIWLLRVTDGKISQLLQVTDTALWHRALNQPATCASERGDTSTSN